MIRAFLAVEPDDGLRGQIAQVQQDVKHRLERGAPATVRIAWPSPASLHLTIKFFGQTDEHLVDSLHAALERAVSQHRVIQMPLTRLGVFPNPLTPRALWVGASDEWEQSDDARRLAALHRGVEACGETFGFAPQSTPPQPHVTIARIKSGERQVAQLLARTGVLARPLAAGVLAVRTIAFMKSDLRPEGAVHTKLWEIDLKAT